MRLLFALTYYRPHISGLTIHVQRVAEAMAALGHDVTVLTARYRPTLPADETINGVRVRRVPIVCRVGKGVVAPQTRRALIEEIARHDLVALSLPSNPDLALWTTRLCRRHSRPMVAMFGCDVRLYEGWIQSAIERWSRRVFANALDAAARVVVISKDYADHVDALAPVRASVVALAPPIELTAATSENIETLRNRLGLRREDRHILFAARIAREKGVEHLLEALSRLRSRGRPYRLVVTGDQRDVVGEHRYRSELQPAMDRLGVSIVMTGELSDAEMAACFATCDVTTLPSVNATESFGMVQVESMLAGTPVVATDLPGVREPISRTGMGRLVAIGDATALAEALDDVIVHRDRFVRPRTAIEAIYGSTSATCQHEALFGEVIAQAAETHRKNEMRPAECLAQARDIPVFRAVVRAAEVQLVRDAGPIPASSLDLGCGDGHFAERLGGRTMIGVDADAHALGESASRGAHRALVRGDAVHLPFRSASFSRVLANSTLEHLPHLDQVLSEIARVLRPDGDLVVTAPSDRFAEMLAGTSWCRWLGLGALARAYGNWFNAHSRHLTTESPEAWRQRLERHGFAVVRAHYYLSPEVHRRVDILHYLSVPNLIAYHVAGTWVPRLLAPWNRRLARWAVRAPVEQSPSAPGPYVFVEARKRER